MKIELFDFQKDALDKLHKRLTATRLLASIDNPQVISFSAPTGAGKTIIMTSLLEDIFFGTPVFDAQPDAIILWISDIPELNEQTKLKIESKSDRIRVRQIVNIDATFDAEKLEGRHIYFINTQKLGSNKLLTYRGDERQYTIWNTFTNTAQFAPDKFYVVIDEAHRGMHNGKAVMTAQSIMQKFLLGSSEDSLCPMPVVIGVSATPRRFEELLSEITHTLYKVYIKPEDVRESGLLKDRILIHFPETVGQAEMTVLASAVIKWKSMKKQWFEYCEKEKETAVKPILVIQVEDGTDSTLTKTNLMACINTIEEVAGCRLIEGEIVHTFNEVSELDIAGLKIKRIDASRIEKEKNVGIVLFKMSLSTGWDCPRAEVMMSFRHAQDHTYIAQLLGRMVRTPLARHIEADASLNDVHLFLPNYDQDTVKTVIKDLKNVEDVPPSETGTSRELVTLNRRKGLDDVFEAMRNLITYRVNSVRKQSSLRRLMALGRGLTQDRIDQDAQDEVKKLLVEIMTSEIQKLKESGLFKESAKKITVIDLKMIALEKGETISTDYEGYNVEVVNEDINRHFQQAGRLLGNGLNMEYWRVHQDRDANEVKVEVIVLTKEHDAMKRLKEIAEAEFNQRYEKHKRKIAILKEQRRKYYERLRLANNDPQDIQWVMPDSIDFRRTSKAYEYKKHLYIEKDGRFRADLGNWEREVLEIELQDNSVVGWLRNVDRKAWSLEIPYRYAGNVRPMFPDLLVVRKDSTGLLFDILEPHDTSLKDNFAKAVGLAEFAEKHWNLFNRIQLIRKKRGADGEESYFRLDVGIDAIRKKVLSVTSNNQLDQIFEEYATI